MGFSCRHSTTPPLEADNMFRLSTLRENRLQAFGLSRYAASTPLAGTRGHVISPPRVSRCPSPQRILGSGQSRVFEQARARAHKHFVRLVTHKVQPRVDLCRRLHTQALCRHLSRKSLLLSSFTLPRLSRKAGSVLPGGRCRAFTTATTPSS